MLLACKGHHLVLTTTSWQLASLNLHKCCKMVVKGENYLRNLSHLLVKGKPSACYFLVTFSPHK